MEPCEKCGEIEGFYHQCEPKEENGDLSGTLNSLVVCEGGIRDDFEKSINALTHVRFSLERNEHGEYAQASVFHMWTGFCMAHNDLA